MPVDSASGTKVQPPGGARFYRCTLQVNLHHNARTYRGHDAQDDEFTHAQKIIDEAVRLGIEVLAKSDHNNVHGVAAFRSASLNSPVHIFPGFELRSSEVVHLLCLYAPDTGDDRLGRYLGECGIRNMNPSAETELLMRIEELDLVPTTAIRLNAAALGEPPKWQPLEDLLTGRKATAVLLLPLLELGAPLIVDQSKNDLDDHFIIEGIVPRMCDEKRRRQFVLPTRNSNVPVLGDAELTVGLFVAGKRRAGQCVSPRSTRNRSTLHPYANLWKRYLKADARHSRYDCGSMGSER